MAAEDRSSDRREITPLPRVSRLQQTATVRRKGEGLHPLGDLFHALMTASWSKTIAIIIVTYLLANVPFSLVYMALGDSIQNARPGNFEDCYFFSVQTMATIGYGSMSPRGTLADFVVSIEAIAGMIAAAVVTGVVFAKFSRPTARVVFSHTVLVGTVDGKRVLMVRLANERDSQIMEPSARLVILRDEVTAEGKRYRRMHDLPLQRDRHAIFTLSWTIFHTIDEKSLLFGESSETLASKNVAFIVSLVGTDETLMQTVHARHTYDSESVIFGANFVDVFLETPAGRVLDVDRLHTYVLEAPSDASAA